MVAVTSRKAYNFLSAGAKFAVWPITLIPTFFTFSINSSSNCFISFKPYFKNTNLNKLTYDHIFEFREYLKTKPKKQNENEVLSYNTINKVLILLKKIFDTGIRKSLIDKNPVKNLRKLPIRKPDIKFWSIEEFTSFRGLIRDDEISYDLFYVFDFFNGIEMV